MARRAAHPYSSSMIVKDHWRITTAAIQLEMERIAGLLEKSVHHRSRAGKGSPASRRDAEEEARASKAEPVATPEAALL